MIVGGTADIASHKIVENGQLHELDHARGDKLGGQLFNESFITFLCELFGENLLKQWASSKYDDYLRLLRAIEGVKWEVSDSDEEVLFEIPYSLIDCLESSNFGSIQERVSKSKFSDDVDVISKTQILIKNRFVRSCFDTIIEGVINHVRNISKNLKDLDTVFIVGGLAKSGYVLRSIKAVFSLYTFIVPEDPGVAVLKGAVLLGNKPQTIAGRISKYSYGIGVKRSFQEGKHDERYKVTRDGKIRCDKIFLKLIRKGQVLKYGDFFTTNTCIEAKLPERKKKSFSTDLYQSTSENPVYYTEPGCTKLGGIQEYPPEGGWPDHTKSEVKIVVGEAEFRFYVTDKTLGRTYETTVDFLSQRENT